jgi:hypothetical protein
VNNVSFCMRAVTTMHMHLSGTVLVDGTQVQTWIPPFTKFKTEQVKATLFGLEKKTAATMTFLPIAQIP